MTTTIKTKPEEFKRFHELLMSTAPEGYIPWYFPVCQNDKDPDIIPTLNRAPNKPICCEDAIWEKEKDKNGKELNRTVCSKCQKTTPSGWGNPWARLTYEEAYKRLSEGKNVGIAARSEDKLIIMDIDNYEYFDQLPNTLTIKSRKRCGKHGFAFSTDPKCKINIPTELGGELRAKDQYVVACGSYVTTTKESIEKEHVPKEMEEEIFNDPNLGVYTVDNPISPKNIFYDELPIIYREKKEKDESYIQETEYKTEVKTHEKKGKYTELFELTITDVCPVRKGRYPHPLHGSDTGKNFSTTNGLGQCWRHNVSLNPVQYLCVESGDYGCTDAGTPHGTHKNPVKGDKKALECAYKQALKRGLIQEWVREVEVPQRVILNNIKADSIHKPMINLPQDSIMIAQFAEDLSKEFVGCEEIYYKPNENILVEIQEYEDKLLKQKITGFRVVDPKRLLNIIEQKVNTYTKQYTKKGEIETIKSATEQTIKLLSVNSTFTNALYPIHRFLNYPLPFIDTDNKLIIPTKGYDQRYQAYFTPETPELTELTVEESKQIINEILSEFCFKEDIDKIMTISYMITPMCRGIYTRPTSRTPLYIILANRERAGKDYLAGVVGIIYEGRSIDDTPFCTTDKDQNNNDELRKKLTSAIKQGRRRIHSSNNKGNLNNAILEQFLTSEIWKDRELGHNKELELNNEVDVSLSANIGITYTSDLWHRCRPINLFYSEENPNERKYTHPDLWGYVKSNRSKILSAIYTLIKTWVDAGSPSGSTPFTSFPEWARVVGGIMDYHKLGNPCINLEDEAVGGDMETSTMKDLFTFMADYDTIHSGSGYTISSLRGIVQEAISKDDMESFFGWDFTVKANQIKFGMLIRRYNGREFTCITKLGKRKIKLDILLKSPRAARVKYTFKDTSIENSTLKGYEDGNVGNVGSLSAPSLFSKNNYLEGIKNLPEITNITIDKSITPDFNQLQSILLDIHEVAIDVLIAKGFDEKMLESWQCSGLIFVSRPGFVRLM